MRIDTWLLFKAVAVNCNQILARAHAHNKTNIASLMEHQIPVAGRRRIKVINVHNPFKIRLAALLFLQLWEDEPMNTNIVMQKVA